MTYIDPTITIAAGAAAKVATPESKRSKRKDAETPAVDLGQDYKRIIEKALQDNPDMDQGLIQEVRELMLSGQLDTPQAARQAAKKIIEYGI